VASVKGGVGKTSCSTHIAAIAAMSGYRVLLLDVDPQGNAALDLGIGVAERDDGKNLFEAMALGRPLEPLVKVRDNLDMVVGGPFVSDAALLAPSWESRGRPALRVLRDCLAPLLERYDLVVLDTPPGDRFLQESALVASTHVVAVTRSDPASIHGVGLLLETFSRMRPLNPDLRFAGVVMTFINPSATTLLRSVRLELDERLGGAAPVFATTIRYLEKAAVEARRAGMLVTEYDDAVVSAAPRWFEAGGRDVDVAKSAPSLASDYVSLTAEILTAIRSNP